MSLMVSSVLWSQNYHAELETLMLGKVNDTTPGLAVGVVKEGEVIFEYYAGLANLEHSISVDGSTRFNIASNAKQFTALCILKLQQEGKLNITDDFRKYLPGYFTSYEAPLPISYLINQSSGIRDFYDLMAIQSDNWWKNLGLDNKDALKLIKAQQEFNFQPGSKYSYSNSNYTLLTAIVESVSGMSFDAYADQMFIELGMTNTSFNTNYMEVIPDKALPYSDWGDGIWKQFPMVTDLHGDGFLFTTLMDQLRWEQLVQQKKNAGQTIITKSQKKIPGSTIDNYGFGLKFGNYLGKEIIFHEGATGSYGAYLIRFPKDDLSIVAMSNSGSVWNEGIAKEIAEKLLDNASILPTSSYPDRIITKPELNKLVGDYLLEDGTLIQIGLRGDNLYRSIYGRDDIDLLHEKGNVFAYKTIDNLKIVFVSNDNDTFDFLLYLPGTDVRKAKRLPESTPEIGSQRSLTGKYLNVETEVSIEIVQESEDKYLLLSNDDRYEGVLLRFDWLQFGDFIFRSDSNAAPDDLFLDYSRLQKVRFSRIDKID